MKQLLKDKKVFLFDFDGTLVDSMGMWKRVDMTIVARHGATVPDDFMDMLVPMSEEESAQCFLDHGCHGTVASILQEINELANIEYAERIMPKSGARELIAALKSRGATLGLITAATPERIRPCLARCGMQEDFSVIVTCDEVGIPKNDARIYRLALERLGARAEDAVFFDDNLTAIRTAKQVGIATVGVYDDHAARHWEDMKQSADGTLHTFDECLPL
jgi:HAD superfamily hydrolase (TIGR01509 family)